jgi:DNA primase
MLKPILTPRDIAERYHRCLPDEIRSYLKGRGVPATLIDRQLLGWNGERITIPIFGRAAGEVLGFRYAKSPADTTDSPEMLSGRAAKPELYGWETLARKPYRNVICEGEFDRLLLEARGIPAVTSTGGADSFLAEWAAYFAEIEFIFICFNRSIASDRRAKKVQQLLPGARVVRLPAEVGEGGTIADFFNVARRDHAFEVLLAGGESLVDDPADRPPEIRLIQPVHRSLRTRAERLRNTVPLHEVVYQFTNLQAAGSRLAGHCPFHEDASA